MFNIEINRLKTGALLAGALVIILILDSSFVFWALLTAILFLSIHEIKSLINIEDATHLFLVGIVVSLSSLFFEKIHYIVFLVAMFLASYYAYKSSFDNKIFRAILYPILPISFLFSLAFEYDTIFLVWLIVVVASGDIGAYIIGKKFGKTKFSKTSPNKTLEGVGGALIVGSIVGSFVGAWSMESWFAGIIISFIVVFFGVFGDLYESYLKRKAKVKDSGDLLPGHGGVLDRVDGFLFAAPVFYIVLDLIKT